MSSSCICYSFMICTNTHYNYMQMSLMDQYVLVEFLRTLVGIIDDYFDGYYTEEMIESQVWVISHPKSLVIFCFSIHLYVHLDWSIKYLWKAWKIFLFFDLFFFFMVRWTNLFLKSWCEKDFLNWVCQCLTFAVFSNLFCGSFLKWICRDNLPFHFCLLRS